MDRRPIKSRPIKSRRREGSVRGTRCVARGTIQIMSTCATLRGQRHRQDASRRFKCGSSCLLPCQGPLHANPLPNACQRASIPLLLQTLLLAGDTMAVPATPRPDYQIPRGWCAITLTSPVMTHRLASGAASRETNNTTAGTQSQPKLERRCSPIRGNVLYALLIDVRRDALLHFLLRSGIPAERAVSSLQNLPSRSFIAG